MLQAFDLIEAATDGYKKTGKCWYFLKRFALQYCEFVEGVRGVRNFYKAVRVPPPYLRKAYGR